MAEGPPTTSSLSLLCGTPSFYTVGTVGEAEVETGGFVAGDTNTGES